MKKFNQFNFVIALVTFAIIFSGCAGVKKMQKDYNKLQFKATPEVLKSKGGKINVNISGNFPEKYFNKKVKMTISPVLKYEGGETTLNNILLKGEKVEGDGITIKNTGGSFSSDYTIDFIPQMTESKMVINPLITFKEKTTALGELKIADGVIITETRVDKLNSDLQLTTHDYEKETIINKTANLFFPYSKFNLDKNLPLNKDKNNIDKINAVKDFLKNDWIIQNININAWASPEGEEKYNENLSNDRAKTTQNFVADFLKARDKEKLDAWKKIAKKLEKQAPAKPNPQQYNYNISAKGEDKEGFVAAVKASDLKDKNAIINVIESEKNKAEREKKIKDMTVIYGDVEKLLEPLRRGEMSLNFLEPKRSDEKIASLSTSYPDSLDIKEILYAASLTNDLNMKLKIYKSAANLYPDSWKAYNNAGFAAFKLGNYDEAGSLFEKANTLSPNNGIVLNNLGSVALAKNNFESAKSYYESAKSQGVNTDYNLGIVLITQGNYEEALRNFESKKCSYNLALAQLLLDNTAGATSTLDCAEKNGEIFYLMAVIGARTQNAQMMNENLKKAIQADAKYRKQAKADREFIKFFNNADFLEITKF